jgi:hypothetical protein
VSNPLHLVSLAVLAAALILAGHWFPWRLLLGRDLRRLEAYAYGVGVFLAVAGVALFALGQWTALIIVLTVWLAEGLATVGGYAIDNWAKQRHALQDAKERAEYVTTAD